MSYLDILINIAYVVLIGLGVAGIVTGIRSMFIELKEIRDMDKQKQ
ncbi:TPA: hypothetical protein ROY01_005708 [Bacillus toyonensis]|nr:hypothetical protein [Bacillus toyonensis]